MPNSICFSIIFTLLKEEQKCVINTINKEINDKVKGIFFLSAFINAEDICFNYLEFANIFLKINIKTVDTASKAASTDVAKQVFIKLLGLKLSKIL